MTIYLLIFLAISTIAVTNYWKTNHNGVVPVLIAAFLTLFIGYRYQVGVDWNTYEIIFLDISRMPLFEAISYGDSGYSLINWVVSRLGGQVWHANLICAAIFSYGFLRFCTVLPRPGLAAVVAVPTLIVVTAMGYTRQATAIGCVMLAFVHFRGTLGWRWLAWLTLSVLFHRSALFVFPLFVIAGSKRRGLNVIAGAVLAAILLSTVVLDNLEPVLTLYSAGDIESSGALARIAIGFIVGILYFVVGDKELFEQRQILIRNMAIAMLALLPFYFIIPSTTVLDRVGILLLPFQCAILSGLAASFTDKPIAEGLITIAIVTAFAIIFLVWLMLATFSSYWVPYENVFFVKWA